MIAHSKTFAKGKYQGVAVADAPIGYLVCLLNRPWCAKHVREELIRRSRLESREGLEALAALNERSEAKSSRGRASKPKKGSAGVSCGKYRYDSMASRKDLSTVERVRRRQKEFNEKTGGKWIEYQKKWSDEKIAELRNVLPSGHLVMPPTTTTSRPPEGGSPYLKLHDEVMSRVARRQ